MESGAIQGKQGRVLLPGVDRGGAKVSMSSTTKMALHEVPRPVLVHSILLAHCTGADVRALASTSKLWWNGLENEDELWKSLYENRGMRFPRCPPRFPTCGTWRDVYLRSIRFESLVIIRTLTRPNEEMRLILSRTTPLYGLKREIRQRQKQLDGVAFEDFELRDYFTKIRLGIAGNDSLPPADLRRLFWMDVNSANRAWMFEQHNRIVGGAPLPGQPRAASRASFIGVDGWRVNLTSISDGAVFEQIFVSTQSMVEPNLQIAKFEKEIESNYPDPQSVNAVLEKSAAELAGVGPTAFKTFWRGHSSVHPLLSVVLDSSLSFRERLVSLILFIRQYVKTLLRFRFLSDVVVNALLRSGFPLAFTRLSLEIFPMVWRTQIRQMLEADFDFGFAIRLLRDVIKATSNAFGPVLKSAAKIEAARVLIHLVWTWESPGENRMLNTANVLMDLFKHRDRIIESGTNGTRRFKLDRAFFDYLRNSHSMNYAMSSLVWGLFERKSDSSLSVTLPLYFYALPVISCAVVLRARVFLAQSYVSLLLA